MMDLSVNFMTNILNIWDKIISWMVPTTFTGVIFLIGFTTSTNLRIESMEKKIFELEKRLKVIEDTRFRPNDFMNGIEPIKIEMRYMSEDIKEIKQIVKERK